MAEESSESPITPSTSTRTSRSLMDDRSSNHSRSAATAAAAIATLKKAKKKENSSSSNSSVTKKKKKTTSTSDETKSAKKKKKKTVGSTDTASIDGSIDSDDILSITSPDTKRKKKAMAAAEAIDGKVGGISGFLSKKKKKKKDDQSQDDSSSVKTPKRTKSPKRGKLRTSVSASAADDASTLSKKKKKKKPVAPSDDSVIGVDDDDGEQNIDNDDDASTMSKRRKKKDKDSSKRKNRSIDDLVPDIQDDKGQPPELANAGANNLAAAAYQSVPGGKNDSARDDDTDLKEENEVLASEIAILRKQLAETKAALQESYEEKNHISRSSAEVTQMQMELRRVQNEVSELKSEIEEYEEAVVEKDGLIKKLTEAVDCQLDKVEYLEIKLQRAEEEFCKMEDEMKDMEDEIENLKMGGDAFDNNTLESMEDMLPKDDQILSPSHNSLNAGSNHSVASSSSLKDVADDMQRRLIEDKIKRLQIREMEIDEFERDLEEREQELLYKDQEIIERDNELAFREEKLADDLEQIRMQQLILEERERDLEELQERLTAQQEKQNHQEYKLLEKAREGANAGLDNQFENDKLKSQLTLKDSEIDRLHSDIKDLHKSLEELEQEKVRLEQSIEHSNAEMMKRDQQSHSMINGFNDEISTLKQTIEKLKAEEVRRKAAEIEMQDLRDDELRALQVGVNKQIEELVTANGALLEEIGRLKQEIKFLEKQIPKEGVDPRDAAIAELQEEIADLREKIEEKEKHARQQREEVERSVSACQEAKQEAKELANEVKRLEVQLDEIKQSSTKKMSQKDETISFMQTEMLRLVKEKQEVDKQLKDEKQKVTTTAAGNGAVTQYREYDDEAEMLRIQGFNEQIRQLDEENRALEEQMKNYEYSSGLKIKKKDSRILELEEELGSLKWELSARKEADFVSLLKDRKNLKKDLDVAKKDLRKSEEHCEDLLRELKELKTHQVDLEKDAEELKKSLVSRDSGDYVSGLKRQIRSLKQHNKTLERNAECLAADTAVSIKSKNEKIADLEAELDDLKNPTKAAVRGMFLKFGKRASESPGMAEQNSVTNKELNQNPTDDKKGKMEQSTVTESPVVPPSPSKKLGMGSLWSAFASPSLRGFSNREKEKALPKEAPIKEVESSDDEETRNDEVPSGSTQAQMSIEDELLAIENELHSSDGKNTVKSNAALASNAGGTVTPDHDVDENSNTASSEQSSEQGVSEDEASLASTGERAGSIGSGSDDLMNSAEINLGGDDFEDERKSGRDSVDDDSDAETDEGSENEDGTKSKKEAGKVVFV